MRLYMATYSNSERRVLHVEVIGEPLHLPQFAGESFAVHANPNATNDNREPLFCVTHVETGFRFAGGDSIDFAIAMAHRIAQEKTAEEFALAVQRARDWLRPRVAEPDRELRAPRIVCAGCGVPTDSLSKPLCDACSIPQ